MNELPKRKSNRLHGYDYNQNGAYFITICTKNMARTFGSIENGQMLLNKFGNIVKQEIEYISSIRKECVVHEFVVMPNHVHLIVEIINAQDWDDYNKTRDDCHLGRDDCHLGRDDCHLGRDDCHRPLRGNKSIPNMVKGLKGAVTRRIGLSPWQRNYHDHIIHSDDDYYRIAEYILGNPVKWQEDRYYSEETALE